MDSARAGTGNLYGSCCDCLVPVRCVIDQHEVEIIPASARSNTSNDYTNRGGSSLDSTSRTAYGNSSYRHQQYQQLSQRAAAARSSTTPGLFFPPHQGSSSLGQAHEASSYRSAAPSELFSDNSRQVSWDSKAPRVPLINLRKIQHHEATLPGSPLDSERFAAAQQVGVPNEKGGDRCFFLDYSEAEGLESVPCKPPQRETLIWEQETPSEVPILPPRHSDSATILLRQEKPFPK